MIVQNSEDKKALHLHVGGNDGLKEANGVFKRLNSVCGDSVEHRKLTETELAERGYDTNFVKQVTNILNIILFNYACYRPWNFPMMDIFHHMWMVC